MTSTDDKETPNGRQEIFILHHFPGPCVTFKNDEYLASDGIPRVIRQIVRALAKSDRYSIKITARRDQVQNFKGYFANSKSEPIEIISIEDLCALHMPGPQKISQCLKSFVEKLNDEKNQDLQPQRKAIALPDRSQYLVPQISEFEQSLMSFAFTEQSFLPSVVGITAALTKPLLKPAKAVLNWLLNIKAKVPSFLTWYASEIARILEVFEGRIGKYFLISKINKYHQNSITLIPHYHLFPEALELESKSVMYIPDFIPHFFEGTNEFGDHESESAIGQALARRASKILTNSEFSRGYLPKSRLQVDHEKIEKFFLPNLNEEPPSEMNLPQDLAIEKLLINQDFLFYPTQPRPNKRLDILFSSFDRLASNYPNLKLVLTCNLVENSNFEKAFENIHGKERVIFYQNATDKELAWLYKNCRSLVFTSFMEGNFPPQIFEALYHRTPIVASSLALITERIKASENSGSPLLLCEPGNVDQFVAGIELCLAEPDEIIARQEPLRKQILTEGSIERFETEVQSVFRRLEI